MKCRCGKGRITCCLTNSDQRVARLVKHEGLICGSRGFIFTAMRSGTQGPGHLMCEATEKEPFDGGWGNPCGFMLSGTGGVT